jgi:phage gpG-like protein
MANKGGHVNVASDSHEEHDHVEYRKRVATYVDGTSASYEDTNFDNADSPAILDVFADLQRIGHEGQVINDGPGRLQVSISADGSTYGGVHTLRGGNIFDLSDLTIKRIKLLYVEPTAYRIMVA